VGYIEKNLVPGEQIIYKTSYHWIVMIGSLIISLLCDAGGIYLIYYGTTMKNNRDALNGYTIAGIVVVILGLIVLMQGIIRKNSTEVAVTNKRVLIKTGIASRRSVEVLLSKVESIGVEEPMWGRMLGYGTVIVRGTGGTNETFDCINHPDELRRQVQSQIGSTE
jgi:uncharacterized membrane protein YdbT with pleckstrin-like domain